MLPFIRDGDVITVRPCKRTDLRKGTVAAYIRPLDGHLAVHRIVGVTEAGFALKGDHALIADYSVAPSGIMGVVDRVERNGRRVRFGLGPEKRLVAVLSVRGLITWAFRAGDRNRGPVS
jgi:hypothetical protein